MRAALTPYSRETSRYTVTIADAGVPYNRESPIFCPYEQKNVKIIEKIKNSDRYINITNKCKDMPIEVNDGEYLDSRKWEILNINRKTDSRGRVHVGEGYYETDIRVFISDLNKNPETCKHYILLPSNIYKEVTKSRKKEEIGEYLKVQKNGDIWTTEKNKDKHVFIFARR